MSKKIFSMGLFLAFAVLLVVTMMAGCTDRRQPKGATGTVTGTVKYQGKPVTVGFTVFQEPTTKKGGAAPLGTDGTYTIPTPMEIGKYNVAFPPPEPPAPHENKKPETSPLPSKYQVPEKATVKFTVAKGANTANFDLE
ncbi:MAG: hypothetical protein FWH27_14350 [Planctomycetaceae bacterium]|nr:hypothetical protein [Planctomycetaceae bacterium]